MAVDKKIQAPGEVQLWKFDWTSRLGSEIIQTRNLQVLPDDGTLVITELTNTSTGVTFKAQSNKIDQVYAIECVVSTDLGRTLKGSFFLTITPSGDPEGSVNIVVEDGSGVAGANSYASVDSFRTYHRARGKDTAGWVDDAVEQGLINATSYIDARWGPKLLGEPTYTQQLYARSILTLPTNPSDDDTFQIDNTIYTFRTTPTVDNEVEIGPSIQRTFNGILSSTVVENSALKNILILDRSSNQMVFQTKLPGITTAVGVGTHTFDQASSYGELLESQPLCFPREGFEQGMPTNLVHATHEYAYRAMSAALLPDGKLQDGQLVSHQRKKIGPIENEFTFLGGTHDAPPAYKYPDTLMKTLTASYGNQVLRY